ncbi:hypothetical protein [Candidatus Clostridium helianthi]|uniref:Transposase n=1 Tax=Candidatus Clostridium helianthi TaxID=3381660 RepID=A0ABW8S156_9CLOT
MYLKNKELEKFLDYVLDKVEECYKKEVEMAMNDFLKETALKVPVQEQPEFVPLDSSGIIHSKNDPGIKCQSN